MISRYVHIFSKALTGSYDLYYSLKTKFLFLFEIIIAGTNGKKPLDLRPVAKDLNVNEQWYV